MNNNLQLSYELEALAPHNKSVAPETGRATLRRITYYSQQYYPQQQLSPMFVSSVVGSIIDKNKDQDNMLIGGGKQRNTFRNHQSYCSLAVITSSPYHYHHLLLQSSDNSIKSKRGAKD